MIQRLTEIWLYTQSLFQRRLKWVGYFLTGAAIVYIVYTTIDNFPQITQIPWKLFTKSLILIFLIYFLSLLLQFVIWTRMLSSYQRIDINDLLIYFKVLILRRLPGGVWHWVGRATLYADINSTPAKVIYRANFLEWSIILLIGILIGVTGFRQIPLPLVLIIDFLLLGVASFLIYKWISKSQGILKKILDITLWLIGYFISWGLGGLIVFLLANTAQGPGTIDLLQATWIWAVSGSSSMLIFPIPMGLGIREFSITLLLTPYLPQPIGIIIALIIRLVFSFADFFWGFLCWILDYLLGQSKSSEKI